MTVTPLHRNFPHRGRRRETPADVVPMKVSPDAAARLAAMPPPPEDDDDEARRQKRLADLAEHARLEIKWNAEYLLGTGKWDALEVQLNGLLLKIAAIRLEQETAP